MLWSLACLFFGLGIASPASVPNELPAETRIHVRLASRLGSAISKSGDTVEAVLITPVIRDGAIILPAGTKVLGTVKTASPRAKPEDRALVAFEFTELLLPDNSKSPAKLKLLQVDNARESVDQDGRITGVLESETMSAKMDEGLEKLSARWEAFAGILQAAKSSVIKKSDVEISYEPGTEFDLVLIGPANVPSNLSPPNVQPIEPENELHAVVNRQPFRTTAQKPLKPSDITNLMFIGSREKLEAAFTAAGWAAAEQLNAKSGLETVAAVAENRGYKEAPMSILLLEGNPPDMVFQKQLNTFAKRHHLRIFQRPETFRGQEVWVCAATHDIGISFSPENKTFIHLIDGEIDKERAKVVGDLVFTGKVKGLALVSRPAVPTSGMNATGDKIETDGAMGVLLFE
jgi:hypothetical protein